jgi:hypothetical protein
MTAMISTSGQIVSLFSPSRSVAVARTPRVSFTPEASLSLFSLQIDFHSARAGEKERAATTCAAAELLIQFFNL